MPCSSSYLKSTLQYYFGLIISKLLFIFTKVVDDSNIKPSSVKGYIERGASMGCISAGDTRWYHKTTNSLPISRKNILSWSKIKLTDAGIYYCYGLYHNNSRHFLSKAILKVYGK